MTDSAWRLQSKMRDYTLPSGRPALMGVLNVTPDSFSDGGQHFSMMEAIAHGLHMVREGADIVDVGGESTRPGAEEVSETEELDRVLPVVQELCAHGVTVSIDTSKPEVARACLDAGAAIVNDVRALQNDGMVEVCAQSGCTVCLMHMQGDPRTMQTDPHYDDVVAEVHAFLMQRALHVEKGGVARNKIWIDPGIGFGKNLQHNLSLLRNLSSLCADKYPVLVGVSRKSFIGKVLGGAPVDERMFGSLACQVLAQASGARIVRAHDVRQARQAIEMTAAVLG